MTTYLDEIREIIRDDEITDGPLPAEFYDYIETRSLVYKPSPAEALERLREDDPRLRAEWEEYTLMVHEREIERDWEAAAECEICGTFFPDHGAFGVCDDCSSEHEAREQLDLAYAA